MAFHNKKIGMLGEIALSVADLDASQAFYTDKIGLELMRRFESSAFFKIAEGYAGHTQILALFDRSAVLDKPEQKRTTLDHIAFTIALEDFESEQERLEAAGVPTSTTTHGWVQWRSLYVDDPDGNTVELVCFDPNGISVCIILDQGANTL